ncbi:unnamed protein product [Dicrocoelium dendriticum]|nr:unnamed protein product [Dicrocoelium dendriticum]
MFTLLVLNEDDLITKNGMTTCSMRNTTSSGLEIPVNNVVAREKIWKDHCQKEAKAAKFWANNWSFLIQTQQELLGEEYEQLRNAERPKPEIPRHLGITDVEPISKFITVKPSPQPIPQRSSGFIGWRSGHSEYNLEKYAQQRRSQGSLLRRFNWPIEATW